MSERLAAVLAHKRVVVCVGPGGVGKTTVAAAIGLHAAAAGRRVLVLTIDPARRLATALGLDEKSSFHRVVVDPHTALDAEMLDARRMLEELLKRHAPDAEALARIRGNVLYEHLGAALSGSQTYLAMEKLYEVMAGYELVVLDTPPAATAVQFLEAPARMVDMLDSSVVRALGQGGDRLVRRLSRFTGSQIFAELADLVRAMAGMFGGFGERARRVADALRGPDCAFVVVVGPTSLAVEEAMRFRRLLEAAGFPFEAFVVNGVQPFFGERDDGLAARLRRALPQTKPDDIDTLARSLADAMNEAAQLWRREQKLLAPLAGLRVEIPRLAEDVHDLIGLTTLAAHLFGSPDPERPRVGRGPVHSNRRR